MKQKIAFNLKKMSCANCGAKYNLIMLPITIQENMFGVLFSCPKCFEILRKCTINIAKEKESK